MNYGDSRLEPFFWDKVFPEPNSGCWLWVGCVNHHGYGSLNRRGRTRLAHRYAYEALIGPIPSGLQTDHRCRTRCCVNPAHLEPVTSAENTRRGDGGINMREKTHCPSGHPYEGSHLYLWRGIRNCRTCRNNRKRAQRAQQRAAGQEM